MSIGTRPESGQKPNNTIMMEMNGVDSTRMTSTATMMSQQGLHNLLE